ncbi:hypothetical protein FHR99_001070 [Litorivivens lipolytica]|uniref:UPF0125 protein FHR99_001070 n=1 Tax=Litorivivens lipolytica TaxID=1524264 RepID=A0A7W4Z4U2_9GAMM|nr:RnfH family protein [Litorivivens lipolytica]MBB3046834.1 hypothetical protein [Litorivivens lipolytica]
MSEQMIHVEVVYATPKKQQIVELELPAGTSVREAALKSGLDAQFDGLDLAKADLGIFGKAVPKADSTELKDGDRVEIYRPLIADPKEVRKQRAAKVKARQEAEGRR